MNTAADMRKTAVMGHIRFFVSFMVPSRLILKFVIFIKCFTIIILTILCFVNGG